MAVHDHPWQFRLVVSMKCDLWCKTPKGNHRESRKYLGLVFKIICVIVPEIWLNSRLKSSGELLGAIFV